MSPEMVCHFPTHGLQMWFLVAFPCWHVPGGVSTSACHIESLSLALLPTCESSDSPNLHPPPTPFLLPTEAVVRVLPPPRLWRGKGGLPKGGESPALGVEDCDGRLVSLLSVEEGNPPPPPTRTPGLNGQAAPHCELLGSKGTACVCRRPRRNRLQVLMANFQTGERERECNVLSWSWSCWQLRYHCPVTLWLNWVSSLAALSLSPVCPPQGPALWAVPCRGTKALTSPAIRSGTGHVCLQYTTVCFKTQKMAFC